MNSDLWKYLKWRGILFVLLWQLTGALWAMIKAVGGCVSGGRPSVDHSCVSAFPLMNLSEPFRPHSCLYKLLRSYVYRRSVTHTDIHTSTHPLAHKQTAAAAKLKTQFVDL